MGFRPRRSTSIHLALLALLVVPVLAYQCPPSWPVYLLLGHPEALPPVDAVMSKDVPLACPGTPADKLDLGDHRSSLAPDGSTYIADWTHNVVLKLSDDCGAIRVAGCNPEQVPPEPGSCQATGLPAPAIDVALDGPWGVDVAADGTVYIPDHQLSGPSGAGRILRLDPDGALSSVANLAHPSQVRVGRDGKLFVAAKDRREDSGITRGIWEIDLPSGSVTELVGGVDSEGIAVYENVETHESLLYAAVQIPNVGSGGGWYDAYICVVDLQNPDPCEVILRPENYEGGEPPVGPDLDPLMLDLSMSRLSRIANLEVDDEGTLYFSHSFFNPRHCIGCPAYRWGGNAPQVYLWRPPAPEATRIFGYPMENWEDFYATYANCQTAIAPGSSGTEVSTFWASSVSMGTSGPAFSVRDCAFFLGGPLDVNYRSYEIRPITTGERLFLGADVATLALESLSVPPTTDPYLAENVVLSGSASFATDPVTQVLQSVNINATYPGVEGGTAYVMLGMNRNGGSLVGNLLVVDDSVGFTHYHGARDVVVSSEAMSGNDIELQMESQDVGGGKGLFAVDIKLRDGY